MFHSAHPCRFTAVKTSALVWHGKSWPMKWVTLNEILLSTSKHNWFTYDQWNSNCTPMYEKVHHNGLTRHKIRHLDDWQGHECGPASYNHWSHRRVPSLEVSGKKLRKERRANKKQRDKECDAYADNQTFSESFGDDGLQSLVRQLWSIHWTLCWPSDFQLKDMWSREQQGDG